jgi:hypothetical protein
MCIGVMHITGFCAWGEKMEDESLKKCMVTAGVREKTSNAFLTWFGVPAHKLKKALILACSEWAKVNCVGGMERDETKGKFNLGDLARILDVGNESLVDILEKHGIYGLVIDVYTGKGDDWAFGDSLMKEE